MGKVGMQVTFKECVTGLGLVWGVGASLWWEGFEFFWCDSEWEKVLGSGGIGREVWEQRGLCDPGVWEGLGVPQGWGGG